MTGCPWANSHLRQMVLRWNLPLRVDGPVVGRIENFVIYPARNKMTVVTDSFRLPFSLKISVLMVSICPFITLVFVPSTLWSSYHALRVS